MNEEKILIHTPESHSNLQIFLPIFQGKMHVPKLRKITVPMFPLKQQNVKDFLSLGGSVCVFVERHAYHLMSAAAVC